MANDLLKLAVRAFTVRVEEGSTDEPDRPPRGPVEPWPPFVLILDTETTVEETQRLTFGSYRYCRWASPTQLDCVEEGLIYADDLPGHDPRQLRGIAAVRRHACP